MMKKEILLIREYPRQVILFWLYLFVYKVCCFWFFEIVCFLVLTIFFLFSIIISTFIFFIGG